MATPTKLDHYKKHLLDLQESALEKAQECQDQIVKDAQSHIDAQEALEGAQETMAGIEAKWTKGEDSEALTEAYRDAQLTITKSKKQMAGARARGLQGQHRQKSLPTDSLAAEHVAKFVKERLHESVPVLTGFGDSKELQSPPPAAQPCAVVLSSSASVKKASGLFDGQAEVVIFGPSWWLSPIGDFDDVHHASHALQGFPQQRGNWTKVEEGGFTRHAVTVSVTDGQSQNPFLLQAPGEQALKQALKDLRLDIVRGRLGPNVSNMSFPQSGGYKLYEGDDKTDWWDLPVGEYKLLMDSKGIAWSLGYEGSSEPELGEDGLYRVTLRGNFSFMVNAETKLSTKEHWQRTLDAAEKNVGITGKVYDGCGFLESMRIEGQVDKNCTIAFTFQYQLV